MLMICICDYLESILSTSYVLVNSFKQLFNSNYEKAIVKLFLIKNTNMWKNELIIANKTNRII